MPLDADVKTTAGNANTEMTRSGADITADAKMSGHMIDVEAFRRSGGVMRLSNGQTVQVTTVEPTSGDRAQVLGEGPVLMAQNRPAPRDSRVGGADQRQKMQEREDTKPGAPDPNAFGKDAGLGSATPSTNRRGFSPIEYGQDATTAAQVSKLRQDEINNVVSDLNKLSEAGVVAPNVRNSLMTVIQGQSGPAADRANAALANWHSTAKDVLTNAKKLRGDVQKQYVSDEMDAANKQFLETLSGASKSANLRQSTAAPVAGGTAGTQTGTAIGQQGVAAPTGQAAAQGQVAGQQMPRRGYIDNDGVYHRPDGVQVTPEVGLARGAETARKDTLNNDRAEIQNQGLAIRNRQQKARAGQEEARTQVAVGSVDADVHGREERARGAEINNNNRQRDGWIKSANGVIGIFRNGRNAVKGK